MSHAHLETLFCKNFTVFASAELRFSPQLNVVIGENGAGKTHLLKLPYSVLAVSREEQRKAALSAPTRALLQLKIAEKLTNVFRPEALGRLARRKQGRERCDIALSFNKSGLDIEFGFATNTKSEVSISKGPTSWLDASAAYFPTRELMTIYPNFVSIYEGHYLDFEETWRDTCLLLGAPLQRGPRESRIRELLEPLENAMNGSIELDRNGRFYLKNSTGRMEMHLVAEGIRKIAMVARLIATGALLNNGFLFWDEPESNLNPRLIKHIAKTIVEVAAGGIQVFIATHSLFLLRELEILLSNEYEGSISPRFFGLSQGDNGVNVLQGDSIDEIGSIATLDEDLEQSDRFLQMENL